MQKYSLFSGTRVLTLGDISKERIYPMKLKGISVCFSMLKAALCGSYVNFGVFRFYGDDALDNALQTFVKLLLSIPQSDLLVRTFCQFYMKYFINFFIYCFFFFFVISFRIIQN